MFGYDYGIKPKVMVVGDVEFTNHLHKASIYGLGYIGIPENALVNQPLRIALIFNNKEYGMKAMQCFHNWINNSNGNQEAFMMDIIESKDGGYTLCFYQGIECLIDRTIPTHIKKWVTPFLANVIHFKEIDHVSENYANFKKALTFSRCNIIGGTKNEIFNDFPDIIKTKINIYTEDNIPEHSLLIAYKGVSKKELEKSNAAFDKIQREELDLNREESLKYFYPITYDKISRRDFCHSIMLHLEHTYEKDIIIQAICNLTLLHRITIENKLDMLKGNYYINILEYLLDSYESVRSSFPNESYFTKELLIKQMELDKDLFKKSI